jgi:arabinofuranan 3-O-arabinosyltransferase
MTAARAWWSPSRLLRFGGLHVGAPFALFAALLLSGRWGWLVQDIPYIGLLTPVDALSESGAGWNANAGLGGITPNWHPAPYLVLATLRGVGLEPWIVARVWYVFLLVLSSAGAGAAARRLGLDSLAGATAGVMYAGGIAAGVYLLPSLLFTHYALAPWLLWLVLGIPNRRAWAAGASGALLVALVGSLNPPALLLASLPAAVALGWLLITRQVAMRVVASFVLTLAATTAVLFAPYLYQLRSGAATVTANLENTEGFSATVQNSSYAESWRGLGSWHLYFDLSVAPQLPYALVFVDHHWVAAATFAVPCLALLGLARLDQRRRSLLLPICAVSLIVMVGGHPLGDATPVNRAVGWLITDVPGLLALRNVYKAVPGLALVTAFGLALLPAKLASTTGPGTARTRRSLPTRALSGLLVVGALALSVQPLVANRLIGDRGFEGIPAYYDQAAAWLNEAPGDRPVLVGPVGATEARTWGTVGPGIEEALIDRPVLLQTVIPQSTPVASNLVTTLHELMNAGPAEWETMAQLARHLGIEFFLVRNDLVAAAGTPAPPELARLSETAGLTLVASFGAGTGELDPEAPLAIYQLEGVVPGVDLVTDPQTMLMEGDGSGYTQVLAATANREATLIAVAPALDDQMLAALDSGADTVVVTDSNRLIDEDPDGPSFVRAGASTEPWFADATSIVGDDRNDLLVTPPEHRPSQAFDGDLTSSWLTGYFSDEAGQSITVTFREPRDISGIVVQRAFPEGGRQVTSLEVVTDTGTRADVNFTGGSEGSAIIGETGVRTLTLRVNGVAGLGPGPFGIAEVFLADLDLAEYLQTPVDLLSRRDGGLTVRQRYVLTRDSRAETALRRRIRSDGAAPFLISGQATISDPTAFAALVGGRSAQGSIESRTPAIYAADQSILTAWQASVDAPSSVTLEVAARVEQAFPIIIDNGQAYSPVRLLEIAGVGVEPIWLQPQDGDCTDQPTCPVVVMVPVPAGGVFVDELRIGILQVEAREIIGENSTDGLGFTTNATAPTAIIDVGLDALRLETSAAAGCVDGLVQLDRQSVPVRLTTPLADIVATGTAELQPCEPVELSDGWHLLEDGALATLDHLVVEQPATDPSGTGEEAGTRRTLPAQGSLAGTRTVELPRLDGPAVLLAGQAFSPGWALTLDDGRRIPPIELNGQAAFLLGPGDGSQRARLVAPRGAPAPVRFLSALAGLVALLAVGFDRLRPSRAAATTQGQVIAGTAPRPRSRRQAMLSDAAVLALGAVIAGWWGALAELVVVTVDRLRPGPASRWLLVAAALVAAAAVVTVSAGEAVPRVAFAAGRPRAHEFGALAVAVALAAVRADDPDRCPPDQESRP